MLLPLRSLWERIVPPQLFRATVSLVEPYATTVSLKEPYRATVSVVEMYRAVVSIE